MTTARDDLTRPSAPSGVAGRTIERLVVVEAVPVRGDGVAAALTATGRYRVATYAPEEAVASAQLAVADPPQLAMIDLDHPYSNLDGVDVASAFVRWCPETAIVLRGGEGGPACERLAANWQALRHVSLLHLTRHLAEQLVVLDELIRTGAPYRDPTWRPPGAAPAQTGSS